MHTTNLNLILSISPYAERSLYLDQNLTPQKIGLFQRIWRAFLSFFPNYFDSSRSACLRASFRAILLKIKSGSLKFSPKIEELFNKHIPTIRAKPGPQLEALVTALKPTFSEGSALLKQRVPASVWMTLEELFKDSLHPLREIPLYSSDVVNLPQREQMKSPIMAGLAGGQSNASRPFIAIAVERISDPSMTEAKPSSTQLIILGQYKPNGPDYWGSPGENMWYDLTQLSTAPHFFDSGNITCPNTGSLVESQKNHFASFQKFLETGEGTDLNGVKWKIVSPTASTPSLASPATAPHLLRRRHPDAHPRP